MAALKVNLYLSSFVFYFFIFYFIILQGCQDKGPTRVHDVCFSALQALANNSPHESIRRSAHGAIWVIKRTPERPTIEQSKLLLTAEIETLYYVANLPISFIFPIVVSIMWTYIAKTFVLATILPYNFKRSYNVDFMVQNCIPTSYRDMHNV